MLSIAKTRSVLRKYLKFVGPGILVSVAYMDPGNYATNVSAGANNRYSLLFIVLLSNLIAIFLQTICIKLGSVTGYDLARCCREYLPLKLNWFLWFLAESAIVATDVAEVIGSAIALNILLKIPLPAGVAITVVDVLVVMIAYRNDSASAKFVRMFEMLVAVLVVGVVVCFAVELSHIKADAGQVFRGFVPSAQMFENGGLTLGCGILGATVMIHSLFLGSSLVQPRLREYDVQNGYVSLPSSAHKYKEEKEPEEETQNPPYGSSSAQIDETSATVHKTGSHKQIAEKIETELVSEETYDIADYFYRKYRPSYHAINYCLKYSIIELMLSLFTFALFVNLAILIVAGSTLYGTPAAVDADLYSIHDLLLSSLAPAVGTIFMVALLFSGQSAGIVCTIAGQVVSEGHINWKLKPWMRRLVTRMILIVPCLAISIGIGKEGLGKALNISQVVISILLPPLTAPLIYFTCHRKIMRIEVPNEEAADAETEYKKPEIPADAMKPVQWYYQAKGAIMEFFGYIEDENEAKSGQRYKYMHNNWKTTVLLVVVWVLISTLNVYAIYDMAANGIASM